MEKDSGRASLLWGEVPKYPETFAKGRPGPPLVLRTATKNGPSRGVHGSAALSSREQKGDF